MRGDDDGLMGGGAVEEGRECIEMTAVVTN